MDKMTTQNRQKSNAKKCYCAVNVMPYMKYFVCKKVEVIMLLLTLVVFRVRTFRKESLINLLLLL